MSYRTWAARPPGLDFLPFGNVGRAPSPRRARSPAEAGPGGPAADRGSAPRFHASGCRPGGINPCCPHFHAS